MEDDEDSRVMLKILSGTWDYQVIEAENGEAAVQIAEEFCPDLILMDIKLPHLDALDTTHRIRESRKVSGVPVVLLSGCAGANYRDAASVAGGNEYLVKPLDFEELQNILGKYLHH
ncbi:MAG: response regulator [Acidobacteriota bacterium]|nr:response regulator [Acidobacteriota bacterium]